MTKFPASQLIFLYEILFIAGLPYIVSSRLRGRTYSYKDIVKIDTGIYGKGLDLLGRHSKGSFYYIIELKDGTKIDLTKVGGTKNEVNLGDIALVEKLDSQFVSLGIRKVSSMNNFKFCTENYDKADTDKIKGILDNTRSKFYLTGRNYGEYYK